MSVAPAPPPASRCAELLAELVERAPPADGSSSLMPAPPWVGWDHEGPGTWPSPDDLELDLNAHPGPDWIDDAALGVRARLTLAEGAAVIGHVDWEAHNIGWDGDAPLVVYDWDSVAVRADTAIAAAAAAVYPSAAGGPVGATIDQSEEFLSVYQRRRGGWSRWTRERRCLTARRSPARELAIGSGAIAVARTMGGRRCRSGSWRRSGRR
jgi:hypothetical protein